MRKRKPAWLDRALLVSPCYYTVCLDEKDFHRELRMLDLPRDTWPSFMKTTHANATTHFFRAQSGKLCAIVTVAPVGEGVDPIQVCALLVHEAVHIWQEVREHIGETSPGHETEAYSIQAIAQNLMFEYKEQAFA